MCCFNVRKTQDGLTTINLTDASYQLADCLAALNKAMAKQSGHTWSTFDLTINDGGNCNANLSYDQPKRIYSIFDDHSYGRYQSCLETYGKDFEATDGSGAN